MSSIIQETLSCYSQDDKSTISQKTSVNGKKRNSIRSVKQCLSNNTSQQSQQQSKVHSSSLEARPENKEKQALRILSEINENEDFFTQPSDCGLSAWGGIENNQINLFRGENDFQQSTDQQNNLLNEGKCYPYTNFLSDISNTMLNGQKQNRVRSSCSQGARFGFKKNLNQNQENQQPQEAIDYSNIIQELKTLQQHYNQESPDKKQQAENLLNYKNKENFAHILQKSKNTTTTVRDLTTLQETQKLNQTNFILNKENQAPTTTNFYDTFKIKDYNSVINPESMQMQYSERELSSRGTRAQSVNSKQTKVCKSFRIVQNQNQIIEQGENKNDLTEQEKYKQQIEKFYNQSRNLRQQEIQKKAKRENQAGIVNLLQRKQNLFNQTTNQLQSVIHEVQSANISRKSQQGRNLKQELSEKMFDLGSQKCQQQSDSQSHFNGGNSSINSSQTAQQQYSSISSTGNNNFNQTNLSQQNNLIQQQQQLEMETFVKELVGGENSNKGIMMFCRNNMLLPSIEEKKTLAEMSSNGLSFVNKNSKQNQAIFTILASRISQAKKGIFQNEKNNLNQTRQKASLSCDYTHKINTQNENEEKEKDNQKYLFNNKPSQNENQNHANHKPPIPSKKNLPKLFKNSQKQIKQKQKENSNQNFNNTNYSIPQAQQIVLQKQLNKPLLR